MYMASCEIVIPPDKAHANAAWPVNVSDDKVWVEEINRVNEY